MRTIVAWVLLSVLSGCAAAPAATLTTTASYRPRPTATAPAAATEPASATLPEAPAATPTPAATGRLPATAYLATFRAADGSQFIVELREAADIAVARELLSGKRPSAIPNGRVVRGSAGPNTGYHWHIDPADFEFADMTTEVCDGLPKDVEAGTITSDRYCPWTAKLIALAPAP